MSEVQQYRDIRPGGATDYPQKVPHFAHIPRNDK
jgi:hypothetical protein